MAGDDQFGTSDVEIIAAAAGAEFQRPAGAVLAEIELETLSCQAIEQVLVQLLRHLGDSLVALSRQRQWHGGRDQVVIVERSLVIRRVDQLRGRLDADDQRRAALNQRHVGAAGMQILRDVMAAVAGSDHERLLVFPILTVGVLAGMQHRAGEILQAGDVR